MSMGPPMICWPLPANTSYSTLPPSPRSAPVSHAPTVCDGSTPPWSSNMRKEGRRNAKLVAQLPAVDIHADVALEIDLEVEFEQRQPLAAQLRRQIKIKVVEAGALLIRVKRIVVADVDVGKPMHRQSGVIALTRGIRRLDLIDLLLDGLEARRILRRRHRRCDHGWGCGRGGGGYRRELRFEFLHPSCQRIDHFDALLELLVQCGCVWSRLGRPDDGRHAGC